MARTVAAILSANTSPYIKSVMAADAANQKLIKSVGRVDNEVTKSFTSQAEVASRSKDRLVSSLKAQEDAMLKSQQAAQKYGKATSWIDKHEQSLNTLSTGMAAFGAVAAGALVGAAKSAMDWESAWAGVTKTVDGSASQMKALEGSLRDMAKTMPESHTQIAAVAEAAGQLGVKTKDIAGFTKVMIELGDTTNLTSDEAATSIAQLMNIMGTAGGDVDRLGATIVDLGNKGASTEKQIVEMGQRIAGAGKTVGLSETEVLGFANALASVGIDAEAGGTAISNSFLKIDTAVQNGGAKLDQLAKTSGMTSTQFVTAWKDDAGAAMTSFIEGMGKVQREGGSTTDILKVLGLTGLREGDALRRLANSGDLLSDSLQNGKTAWEQNSALAVEAGKRYATTESQVKIAFNNIKDAAIDFGAFLLPMVADIAKGAGGIGQAFNKLPNEVKSAMTGVTVALAALGLGGAAVIKVITGAAAMRKALTDIGLATGPIAALREIRTGADSAGVALTTMGRAGRVAQLSLPLVGVAVAGVSAAIGYFVDQSAKAKQRADDFGSAFETVEGKVNRATAALNDNVKATAVTQLQQQGAFDDARKLGLSVETVTQAALGNKDAMAEVAKAVDDARKAGTHYDARSGATTYNSEAKAAERLNGTLNGTSKALDSAVQSEKDRRAAMDSTGGSLDENTTKSKANAAAQKEIAVANARVDASATDLRDSLTGAGVATDKLTDNDKLLAEGVKLVNTETEKLQDNLTILKNGALDVESASNSWLDALDNLKKDTGSVVDAQDRLADANDDVREAERKLDKTRRDGKSTRDDIKDAEKALRDARKRQADATDDASKANTANSYSLNKNTKEGRSNREQLGATFKAMNDDIRATFKNTNEKKGLSAATKEASSKLEQHKKDLEDAAVKAGFNRKEVHKMIDQMVLTPKELKTEIKQSGIDDLKKKITDLQKQIDDLKNKDVKLQFDASFKSGFKLPYTQESTGNVIVSDSGHGHYATGGYVSGPGTGTSDDIPARLSNGEFVVKASSVQRLGVDRLNYINQLGDVPAFRDGGLVNNGPSNNGPSGQTISVSKPIITLHGGDSGLGSVTSAIGKSFQTVIQNATKYAQGTIVNALVAQASSEGGLVGAGSFAKALDFAKSQAGKPYVWAAAGPGGYDCSGFMGAIQNVIEGKSPYSRRWSTMAFNGQEQAQGYTKNADSAFKIGVTNAGVGHTAGTINGVNVESRGGAGVIVGPKARGWNDSLFPMHYGLTSGMPGKKGIGGVAGGNERPTGTSQQIFRKMMLIAGYPESDWHKVDYIISHESGWNVHATNPSSGAYGLGQAYPGSKMAAFGPDWRDSASTQGAWFFDYIKRYGGLSGAYNFWQGHHWYADGGPVHGPGGGRDDKIPAMLSNGEFVVNAAATSRHRELLSLINSGDVPKFATGGQVGTSAFGTSSVFSVSAIVKLIRALENPTHELHELTYAVKKAATAQAAATKALKAPKATLTRATNTYNDAVERRNNLRLTNARSSAARKENVDAANKALSKQKDLLAAAKLSLQKLAPSATKAAAAQRTLNAAIASRDSKARANTEQIAKYNDRIAKAKKGTVAYNNLINSKELAQKANAREIAAANAKITSAKKAAQKAGVNTGKIDAANLKVKKAQQAVDKAQDKLDAARAKSTESSRTRTLKMAEANAAVTKASAAKKKAQDAYNAVLDKSKAKSDAYKQAQEDLAAQQKALADAALQVSNAFSDAYLSKSSAVADWLQSMSIGTKDITGLTTRIAKLRKLGLSETLIQQIIGMSQSGNAPAGQAISDAIITGGAKTVKSLNTAATKLQDAADVLGYKAATGTGRYATGGLISGPGTGTSDSITARISNGEYVVNARATSLNRPLLDHINYGIRGTARFASGGYAGSAGGGMSKQDLIAAVAAVVDSRPMISGNNIGYDPAAIGRELDRQRASKLHNKGVGVFR